MSGTTTVLAARAEHHDLAFEASSVVQVVSASDWQGPLPVDLEDLIDGLPPRDACRHVLIIRTDAGQWPLGTPRELVMRELSTAEIHQLPALLWPPDEPRVIQGIADLPDLPPLLLLDAAALRARADARRPPEPVP